MRFIFLFSGFVGFATVAIAGLSAQRQPDLVLRDAALGCLAGALLGRWFWRVLQRAVEQTATARRLAAEAAAEAEAAKPRPPISPGKAATASPLSSHSAAPHRAPTPVTAR